MRSWRFVVMPFCRISVDYYFLLLFYFFLFSGLLNLNGRAVELSLEQEHASLRRKHTHTHTHTHWTSVTDVVKRIVCNISQRLHVTSFRSLHPLFRVAKKVLDLSGFPARSPVAQPATRLQQTKCSIWLSRWLHQNCGRCLASSF